MFHMFIWERVNSKKVKERKKNKSLKVAKTIKSICCLLFHFKKQCHDGVMLPNGVIGDTLFCH